MSVLKDSKESLVRDVSKDRGYSYSHVDGNMLVAFLLNLGFSVFEFVGGVIVGSTAILSDAVHDLGDAVVVGLSWFMERKSHMAADTRYTYGYRRYSVIAAVASTSILIVGSAAVIVNAIAKLFDPPKVNSIGMLVFACVGVIVNGIAAWRTHGGDSLNQRAVNLHMLEDVLGWLAVLVGAAVIHLTGCFVVDPLLSIVIALFVAHHAFGTFKEAIPILLEAAPDWFDFERTINAMMSAIPDISDVKELHVWQLDEETVTASAVVSVSLDESSVAEQVEAIRNRVKETLADNGIASSIVEIVRCD